MKRSTRPGPRPRRPRDEASPPAGRHPPARDQRPSAFASILDGLVGRVPGARAAALVDFEGETVDYAGRLEPFAIRIAAAHWRVVFDDAAASLPLQGLRFLALRASGASYLVHDLPEHYALVLVLARAAAPFGCRRAVTACAWELAREAGWKLAQERPAWLPLEVLADARRRPAAIRVGERLLRVEVLGSVVDAAEAGVVAARPSGGGAGGARRERAWRVRFESGVEATLVREPGGAWYSDEPAAPPEEPRVGRARPTAQTAQTPEPDPREAGRGRTTGAEAARNTAKTGAEKKTLTGRPR